MELTSDKRDILNEFQSNLKCYSFQLIDSQARKSSTFSFLSFFGLESWNSNRGRNSSSYAFCNCHSHFKKEDQKKSGLLNPQISQKKVPVDDNHKLPASANLPELADEHDCSIELPTTSIAELLDTSRRNRVEMP